jgi:hypothetical protein
MNRRLADLEQPGDLCRSQLHNGEAAVGLDPASGMRTAR